MPKGKAQPTKAPETEYDNSLTGAMFINEKKKSDKHPDFQGTMTDENGKEFWISGWKKVSKSGVKFISLSFRAKEEAVEEAAPNNAGSPPW